jgi:outer membrane receptor protein involved in Fe transport
MGARADDQPAVLVYAPTFFAEQRPNTAYDMIGRLPAFTFDDGNTARGFAGTAGNVLIDGQRPTSKTDDLQSILTRINTGESIARATVRYLPMTTLTLEAGAEGAYNFLNGTSSFLDNGAVVALPSADARVNEKRAEAFGQATWKISDQWMVEAGARFEYSIISETGDVNQRRDFFYPSRAPS